MKLSQFIQRIKLGIPNIGQTPGITNAYITDLLNQGCDQSNLIVEAYKTHTDFDVVANQKIYSLATICPLFIGRDKRGVFFKNSNGDWVKVFTKTEAYLAENFQNYLNSASVDQPQFYFIDGDDFGFEPAAATSQSAGARVYHLKKASPMSNDDHYPFSGSATEIPALIPMDEAILAWVMMKIAPAYGQNTDINLKMLEFQSACKVASRLIKRAPDLSNSNSNTMRL